MLNAKLARRSTITSIRTVRWRTKPTDSDWFQSVEGVAILNREGEHPRSDGPAHHHESTWQEHHGREILMHLAHISASKVSPGR